MKKTRILAGILCFVMLSVLPGIHSSAMVSADLYDIIGGLMGATSSKPVVNHVSWFGMNFDFTQNFNQTAGISKPETITYDNTNGLTFSEDISTWRYYPEGSTQWSPMVLGGYYLRLRVNEGGVAEAQACKLYSNNRSYITFSTTNITAYQDKTDTNDETDFEVATPITTYEPGTDWNDVVILTDGDGYTVYAKKESDTSFTKVVTTTSYRPSGKWKNDIGTGTGLTLSGKNAYVSDAVMLEASDTAATNPVSFDSIEDIIGPYATSYNLDLVNMDSNYLVEATKGEGVSHNGSYSENGFQGAMWKFLPTSGWTPLYSGETETAISFTAKVGSTGFNVQGYSHVGGRVYFDIKSGETPYSNAPSKTFVANTFKVDSNWAEYLITQNATGYSLYTKSQSTSNGKWLKIIETSDYDAQENNKTGITFSDSDLDSYIKNVKIYHLNAVPDDEAKPESETELLYGEDFDEVPVSGMPSGSGISYSNGNLLLTENTESDGAVRWRDIEIPKGGYAEFRMNVGATAPYLNFFDGTTCYTIYHRVSYGVSYSSAEKTLYSGDGGDVYRTWRVIRHDDGRYSCYSKSDSDSAWFPVAVEVTGKTDSTAKQILFEGSKTFAGDEGVAKLDYMRIYGPNSGKTVTLIDGPGIKILEDGEQPRYPEAISVLVKPDASKNRVLLIGIYGLQGNLVDLIHEEIPAGTETTKIFCNALRNTNEVRKIKTFLWENTGTILPVTPATELKGNVISWEDDWNFGGKATVEDNKIMLNSTVGNEAYAEYETEIGSQFDISWNMMIDAFGGAENAQISTGTHKILLEIANDSITCNTAKGNVTIPWIIGNGMHSYRLFGDQGSAVLSIDGFYVTELSNLESSAEGGKIRFQNRGASQVEVSNVNFNAYDESKIPPQGIYDDFEDNDTCGWSTSPTKFTVDEKSFTKQWINSKDGRLVVEDYHLAQSPNYCITSSNKAISEVGDEFVLQTEILFPSWGTESYMVLELGNKKLSLDIREKFFSVGASAGYSSSISDEFLLGTTESHIITIESYNRMKNARIFLDGKLVQDTELSTISSNTRQISFQTNGGWYQPATMQIEYIKYAPKYYSVTMTSPANQEVFSVGEPIVLSASKPAEFILNGISVGTGESVTIDNLPAGNYDVVAQSGGDCSDSVRFTVEEKASAVLQISQNGASISASLGAMSGLENVVAVSYLLDGKVSGKITKAPYQVTIPNISAENHIIEAVAYDKAGVVIGRFAKEVPAVISGNITTSYSNQVQYTAAGDGVVEVKNGTHVLCMTHSSSNLAYVTAEGTKNYAFGSGSFVILTDGPYAEVYRNGQYAFGFCMPKTTEVGTTITGNITGGSVTIPAERNNYFSARNLNVQSSVYELADITHNHNLDFVASPEDEVHLALNDGYYRNDITLKDGAIFVWEAARNNSVPKQNKVLTMASGDVYYRVETSAGMSRIYADGKWVYTFRNGQAVGHPGVLSVDVTGGDGLSYLGVNSNRDIYLYTDTFDQSGEFASTDYWMTSNNLSATQSGEDLLLTSVSSNGIAELSSSVGNASLTAHLTITPGTKGFWMIANHSVTDSYTKVGYNYQTNQFEIIDVINGSESSKVTKSGTLPTGARVLMKLVVEETEAGKRISLSVGDDEVISKNDSFDARGRLGFMVSNGKASLGYVVYRGDAKPMVDIRDNPIYDGITTLDMIETDEKTYLVNGSGGYTTTDGGKNWERFTISSGQGLSTETGVGMTPNMVRLQNGEVISMVMVTPPGWRDEYGQRRGYYRPYYSKDDGMNWSHVGTQNFPPEVSGETLDSMTLQGRGATVNAVSQGPSGRIYHVLGGGNSEDYGYAEVWMSDTNGRSWFKSMTQIDALQTGYVIAEAKVIETTRNTRFYFRTDKGQICYYESYDYGESWDMIPHSTPFISSMTCFSVEADPDDPDTLYIGWGFDNINLYARPQFPRTRWAVAKSTDAGVTWEMVGTVHENNSIEHNMMNLNINVGKDYIYLNAFSSDNFGQTIPWSSRIVSFPKDKQRTSPRLEQLHTMYPTQVANTMALPDEKETMTMAVHPSSGQVLLRGQLIPGAVNGEYVALDVAAAFIGATTKIEDANTVTFCLGNVDVNIGTGSVKTVSGKKYIKLSVFADKFDLTVTDEGETIIVSRYDDWSVRQRNALRYATDLFASMP